MTKFQGCGRSSLATYPIWLVAGAFCSINRWRVLVAGCGQDFGGWLFGGRREYIPVGFGCGIHAADAPRTTTHRSLVRSRQPEPASG